MVKNKEHKIMAFDVDGTLITDNRKILDSTIKSVQELQKHGVKTVICTGRSYCNSVHVAEAIGKIDYIVSCNGAQIYDVVNKKLIYSQSHDVKITKLILKALSEISVSAVLYGEHETYLYDNKNDKESRQLFEGFYGEFKTHLSDDNVEDFIENNNIVKVIIYFDDVKRAAKISKMMKTRFADVVYVVRGSDRAVEFCIKGINKSTGILKILESMKLSPDNLVAIGDSENDIEMLKLANLGIAMGNALPEVKAISDEITKNNNDHGIEHAIKKYVFSAKKENE